MVQQPLEYTPKKCACINVACRVPRNIAVDGCDVLPPVEGHIPLAPEQAFARERWDSGEEREGHSGRQRHPKHRPVIQNDFTRGSVEKHKYKQWRKRFCEHQFINCGC